MGGLSALLRQGIKGLKKYKIDYKFKSPTRYEDGRNIGPLETMRTTTEIEAPSLGEAKKLLKQDKQYIKDKEKLQGDIGFGGKKPRVSFQRIKEDDNIIQESATPKRFRLEQESRVLPYLKSSLPKIGDKEDFLPIINKIINDPKLNKSQKNKIITYVNQYADGLLTPEELYNKSIVLIKKQGGRIMNDPNKTYNTQRAI